LTRKIAIFTEGKTEQILVCKLIEKLAGEKAYHINKLMANGGRRFALIEIKLSHEGVLETEPYDFYFLVLNCGNEDHVVSMLKDRIAGLTAEGFTQLIGVRDLRPKFTYDEYEQLLAGSLKNFEDSEIQPLLVIARMEVEAWFIAENTHFTTIDETLTAENILEKLGVDIKGDSEKIEIPADTLSAIYDIAGKEYRKSGDDIQRTVDALNISEFKADAGNRAPTIKPLIECVEKIFE
jgi:hypothetical protein